ncbi:endonuclease VII domain-containing protein [Streptomyces sp. N35]|uniref:endonuclease VII domain-containing protein n=1 Tax=Streptomyces sp. N35 TaxID=2795730 RepID=UPI0018F2FCCB|nr:endonuclease VII domain-containing protein [Streptomyces sp. N35]
MFSKQRNGSLGRSSVCKPCRSAYNRELRSRWSREGSVGTHKVCPGCGQNLPLTDYYKAKSNRLGVQTNCKSCTSANRTERYREDPQRYIQYTKKWAEANRDRVRRNARSSRLLKKYGITGDEYEALLEAQDGRCAICGTTEPGLTTGGHLTIFRVDHCHATGAVRGLLCNNCNIGIGQLGDDPERVEAALHYLRNFLEKARL